jgi:hypothetical protein
VQFSEVNGAWQVIPRWADFLVRLGFEWPEGESETRRIGLISMPCDSAAAGLVALGAMRRRLELDNANDLTAHFQRLRALALRGADDGTRLRYRSRRERFVVDKIDDMGMVWVEEISSKTSYRRTISIKTAVDWRFEGEAPVQVISGDKVLYERHYVELVQPGGAIKSSNLTRSDSGICLAGRIAGGNRTRTALAAIRFKASGDVADLSQLLTVHSWSPGMISRVSFFNCRTGQLDRSTGRPGLVVADGDMSFLKVADKEEFRQSDVVGLMYRTVERDRLEAVRGKLASLEQWYKPDTQLLCSLPQPPRGIGIAIFKRM